ncbi:DUF72 domain-containing protein [Parasegetibacter sp. NRK P23]|uniref:DUF72 domain-containing protein n=1 Tax=Parasegetibacter sp. NRK P23 TaxID=2942999 RepID=UPI0020448770|nr:DUF72 domain-containing protein [Parasegetibacter sp. NRK P23]MCM5529305.1 DUF72 domain-containing protein [Parasegetibacter sp. NRK P23]
METGRFFAGTSGWHYKHWKNTFYPADVKQKEQFTFYTRYFDTVEINNSFCRLPEASTLTAWQEKSPEAFLFAMKAGRFLTHLKKLDVDQASVHRFLDVFSHLGDKLGPVLFQLPPGWQVNVERLRAFFLLLPQGLRYVFEFRNSSWYNEEVYAVLRTHNAGFCIYELAGHLSPEEVTADFVYIRLHGPGAKYQGSYPDETLETWATKVLLWMEEGKDVYLYFDNDDSGFAPQNALTIKKIVSQKIKSYESIGVP